MRLRLTLAYDGRGHAGWQSQPGGNTVQDLLEKAATETAKVPVRIHGAGRTDAGVHALAQVAHFDPPDTLAMNSAQWVPALNSKLPRTIRVLRCEEVPASFHARFSATGKDYRYDICTEPVLSPFRAGLAWHVPQALDAASLRDALQLFLGLHDFRAFAAFRGNETPATDYRRTITQLALTAVEDGLRLSLCGDGFLYRMVRMITGTAVACALGRIELLEIERLLRDPGSDKTRHCAPPDGLWLVGVRYENP